MCDVWTRLHVMTPHLLMLLCVSDERNVTSEGDSYWERRDNKQEVNAVWVHISVYSHCV